MHCQAMSTHFTLKSPRLTLLLILASILQTKNDICKNSSFNSSTICSCSISRSSGICHKLCKPRDVSFLTNIAKTKQHVYSEAHNYSYSSIGNSGGNSVISANVQTATVTQNNSNPHANLANQSTTCDLFGGSFVAFGCC